MYADETRNTTYKNVLRITEHDQVYTLSAVDHGTNVM